MNTIESIRVGTLLSQKVNMDNEIRHYLFEVGDIEPTDLEGKPLGFWQKKGIVSINGGPWESVPNDKYDFEGAHEQSKNLQLMSPDEWEIWDDFFRKETYKI